MNQSFLASDLSLKHESDVVFSFVMEDDGENVAL